jgi:uncharacterized protein (TIGR02611 family)
MVMRSRLGNEQSIPKVRHRTSPYNWRTFGASRSPSWMKWFSRIWNIENIKIARRVIVSVIGVTVLLIGVALLVLPGPAFIVIPIGLAILATEYAWARCWLKKVRRMASNVVSRRERTPSQTTSV